MINDNDEMKRNETKPNNHEASIKLSSYSKDGWKNSDTITMKMTMITC